MPSRLSENVTGDGLDAGTVAADFVAGAGEVAGGVADWGGPVCFRCPQWQPTPTPPQSAERQATNTVIVLPHGMRRRKGIATVAATPRAECTQTLVGGTYTKARGLNH